MTIVLLAHAVVGIGLVCWGRRATRLAVPVAAVPLAATVAWLVARGPGALDGRPVTFSPVVHCGTCEPCRHGHSAICQVGANAVYGIHRDGGMGFGGLTTNAPPNSVSCAWQAHDAQNGLYPPSSNHSGGVNAVMGDGDTVDADNDEITAILAQ